MSSGNAKGDICSRYATYTKCVENLIAPCPASVKNVYTTAMESEKRIYSSQLAKCQSSESSSSGSEKQSSSGSEKPSGSSVSIVACDSAKLQSEMTTCQMSLGNAKG